MELLFVYGTLRRGGSANHKMRGAKFIVTTHTNGGYALAKYHGLPGIMESGKSNEVVKGDLYEVTEDHLYELDRYEDRRYQRKLVDLNDGNQAWAYVLPDDLNQEFEPVKFEDW